MNSIAMHSTADFRREIMNDIVVNLHGVEDRIRSCCRHDYAHRDIGDVIAENEDAVMSAGPSPNNINAEPGKGSESVVADRELVAIVAFHSMKAVHRAALTAVLKFQTINGDVRHRGPKNEVADGRASIKN